MGATDRRYDAFSAPRPVWARTLSSANLRFRRRLAAQQRAENRAEEAERDADDAGILQREERRAVDERLGIRCP